MSNSQRGFLVIIVPIVSVLILIDIWYSGDLASKVGATGVWLGVAAAIFYAMIGEEDG